MTGAGFAGVRNVVVTWQPLQPTCVNSGWPRVDRDLVAEVARRRRQGRHERREQEDVVLDLGAAAGAGCRPRRRPGSTRGGQAAAGPPAAAARGRRSRAAIRDAVGRRFDRERGDGRPLEAVLGGDAHLVRRRRRPRTGSRLGMPAFQPNAPTRVAPTRCGRIAAGSEQRSDAVDGAADRGRLARRQPVEERVGHRVDQAEAEQRRGQAADVADGGVRRLAFRAARCSLVVEAGERAEREELAQRAALVGERVEDAVDEPAEAPLDLLSGAAMAPLVWQLPQAGSLKIGPRPSLASSNALNAVVGFSQQVGVSL